MSRKHLTFLTFISIFLVGIFFQSSILVSAQTISYPSDEELWTQAEELLDEPTSYPAVYEEVGPIVEDTPTEQTVEEESNEIPTELYIGVGVGLAVVVLLGVTYFVIKKKSPEKLKKSKVVMLSLLLLALLGIGGYTLYTAQKNDQSPENSSADAGCDCKEAEDVNCHMTVSDSCGGITQGGEQCSQDHLIVYICMDLDPIQWDLGTCIYSSSCDTGAATCGNGICETGEPSTCSADCSEGEDPEPPADDGGGGGGGGGGGTSTPDPKKPTGKFVGKDNAKCKVQIKTSDKNYKTKHPDAVIGVYDGSTKKFTKRVKVDSSGNATVYLGDLTRSGEHFQANKTYTLKGVAAYVSGEKNPFTNTISIKCDPASVSYPVGQ